MQSFSEIRLSYRRKKQMVWLRTRKMPKMMAFVPQYWVFVPKFYTRFSSGTGATFKKASSTGGHFLKSVRHGNQRFENHLVREATLQKTSGTRGPFSKSDWYGSPLFEKLCMYINGYIRYHFSKFYPPRTWRFFQKVVFQRFQKILIFRCPASYLTCLLVNKSTGCPF